MLYSHPHGVRTTCRHVPTSRALPPRHLRLSTATIEASEEDAQRQVDHLHQAAEEQLHAQSGGASGIKNVHLTIEIPQGARPGPDPPSAFMARPGAVHVHGAAQLEARRFRETRLNAGRGGNVTEPE